MTSSHLNARIISITQKKENKSKGYEVNIRQMKGKGINQTAPPKLHEHRNTSKYISKGRNIHSPLGQGIVQKDKCLQENSKRKEKNE